MTKRSPDGLHTAKLKKKKLLDVNFIVAVDGKVVYGSPDVRPLNIDFREQLVWDTNSQRVLLEVADERIFGYHVEEKRPLTSAELQDFHFTPFREIHFEGSLHRSTYALTNSSSPAPPAP